MEFDPAKIKCSNCNADLNLFFQKGAAVSGSGIDKAVLDKIYGRLNDAMGRLNDVMARFEDFEARLGALEDFLARSSQQHRQQEIPRP